MKDILIAIFSGIICAAVILSAIYFDAVKAMVHNVVRGEIVLENEENLYYYNRLNDKEKKAYKKIVDNADKFPEKIQIPYLEEGSLSKVLEAISYDQPDIFNLGINGNKVIGRGYCYFQTSYDYDRDTYAEHKKKQDEKIDYIVSQVDSAWSDYEKELFVYDYIITHCAYAQEEETDAYKAYGALVNGKATCEGYAKAMQAVLGRLGIKNFLISGTAKDVSGKIEGHIWNAVEIEGEYYYIDATWDDPLSQNDYGPSHVHFNLSFNDISKNHYEFEEREFSCKSTSQNYFIKNGLYFNAYNDNTLNIIKSEINKTVQSGKDKVEFRFSDNSLLQTAKKSLLDNNEITRALAEARNAYQASGLRSDFKTAINESCNTITILLSYER